MEKKIHFKVKEFNNMKEIIYNSAEVYSQNIAFVIKNKEGKNISYTNISYKNLLEDINSLGTELFSIGLKDKRIAIIGKNSYEWIQALIQN